MMFRLHFLRRTRKELEKLPRAEQERVWNEIRSIRERPFEGKKMEGDFAGYYGWRVWPYRIIYAIEKKTVTIVIVRIGHRQGVYK